MEQLVFRFLFDGLVVSLFAAIADVVKPKSFAGLFGAAPSVALATLGLSVATEGRSYAAIEARSMVAGAVGFFLFALLCAYALMKYPWPALKVTSGALVIWFATIALLYFSWLT